MKQTLLSITALSCALYAGETRTWSQSDYADFEKGVIRNLSIRSDGLLSIAPHSREFFDPTAPYLWALAHDSKGNLYTGGGTGAKLYRIPPDGKGKLLADLDALEIHAIAVDSKDRIYAATAPDGKIYRISGSSKPETFYEPHQKYIWALAFDSKGNLFVATGDQGEIHRVTPDGKGRVFFKTDETHVRSMAVDRNDNVIVGTDPGGLVMRISPAGEGFVLYQMAKREVTAVAVASDGTVYAAAVGSKSAAPPSAPQPAPAPPPAQATVTVSAPGAPAPAAQRPAAPPPASLGAAPGVAGGSEVYRIEASGNPRRVWSHTQDVVYSLAFDSGGRLLLGAGNKGSVYRIESPTRYSLLLTVPATQITAFQAGADGRLYAATGNVGKVYEIGPALEHEGTIESDVFDAAVYTQWGMLTFAANGGGQVAVATRSGNLDQPQKNWSPWSQPITNAKGARVTSPSARFLQWKATLTAGASGASPELQYVDVAYLPKNVEPRIDQIEMTPPNYKFPAPAAAATPALTLSLPPLGRRNVSSAPAFSVESTTSTPAMQLAKGWVGARWVSSDPNGDSLIYRVEIRGANEKEWKLLKEKVAEKYTSWDSTAFPDGEYRLRITASDAPGNPPSESLTAQLESDAFVIDNTPPKVSNLAVTRNGGKLVVRWHAADALNNISKAEYSIDGGEWTMVAPVTRLSDAAELDYELTLDAPAGEHTIAVRVEDEYENQVTEKVVVK